MLNCRLLNFYFVNSAGLFRGGFFSANRQFIEPLPIRPIDFDDPKDAARHKKMVALVTQMLDLHKRLPQTANEHERTLLERRIQTTDNQIDALVYELYGLTEDEIAIVEEAAS
ncbi:MAG: hypothetical protein IIB09_08960 [Bacteroidetes bacterium]|nr:hypothetical protein [Bacteroidota bacterium]